MKVLRINGSPKEHGNTFLALSEVAKTLGRNMAWMIKKLNVAEDGHPEKEQPVWTNFIR